MLTDVLNIVIGISIGYLFYYNYISPPIIHGPNSAHIVNQIYTINGIRYKLYPRIYPKPI